ncbi:MAG: L-fucose isomerase [Spirochaetia bacterium]|nr:L-fucose isomerase [Spirochaetia bacterium]
MDYPKVGIMTFGDHRGPEWDTVFSTMTIPRHAKAVELLTSLPLEVISFPEVARTRDQIDEQVDALKHAGIELFIVHTPCWTSPNLVVHGVQRMGAYTIIIGNRDMGTHGCVGLFGAAGALSQIGSDHRRIRMDYDLAMYEKKLLPLIRAASTAHRLKGSVLGYFGGRSIGIDTATFDPMGWKKQFGVDVEHIDQIEIVRIAETISQDRIDRMRVWIEENAKEVLYNDGKFTKEKFDFQIACYIATKDICRDQGLDFTAIKCMPELSNSYVPQCMTAAFLPNNFDGEEGEKDAMVMACEADGDGALTQQMLKLISGGMPTFFADVSHIDDARKTLYCVNCGAVCAWYAGRDEDPGKNLNRITIKQSIRPGGGAITGFFAAPGAMQLARLYRVDGKYRMAIIPCTAVTPSEEILEEFVAARGPHQLPALFAEVDFDLEAFVDEYGSNHISGVAGEYVQELVELCKMLGIEPVVFT